jgi:hypothetical protein
MTGSGSGGGLVWRALCRAHTLGAETGTRILVWFCGVKLVGRFGLLACLHRTMSEISTPPDPSRPRRRRKPGRSMRSHRQPPIAREHDTAHYEEHTLPQDPEANTERVFTVPSVPQRRGARWPTGSVRGRRFARAAGALCVLAILVAAGTRAALHAHGQTRPSAPPVTRSLPPQALGARRSMRRHAHSRRQSLQKARRSAQVQRTAVRAASIEQATPPQPAPSPHPEAAARPVGGGEDQAGGGPFSP